MLVIFIPVFMWVSKNKNKVKEKETTLKELIKKSRAVRKNIDTIMAAFKRIEKHITEMQQGLDKKDARQDAMSQQLEKLVKNMKQLDQSMKGKNK
jgi:septation ring formation regulator EzrA